MAVYLYANVTLFHSRMLQLWCLQKEYKCDKMRQKLLCFEAKVSSHRQAMNRCCIKLSWRDVSFVVRMFSSMPGCFPVFQDVCFPFGMFSSLSGCILPYQDVFFPVRMYFSLSESISSVGLYCSLSRCFLLCYFSVRIYSSLSECILLLIDHTEWSDFLFYQDIRIYNLDIYT